ncbi:MAG: hypothetical protein U9P72_04855 [Campylobacterota bacterium]|nr:hypothetical protein [Campylobacterota bacterium]
MDSEIIYTLLGITIFAGVAFIIFRSDLRPVVSDEQVTKEKIIDGYKKELYDVLLPLKDDKEQRIAEKKRLLKKFSDELHRNIFFDTVEIKEYILDIAESS